MAHCFNSVASHWAPKSLGFERKYLPKVLHQGARNPIPRGIRQVPMSVFSVAGPHVPKDNIAPILNRKKASTNSVLPSPQRLPALACFLPPNRLKALLLLKMGI